MRTALRGYDRDEVDAFLDRCVAALGVRASALPELRDRPRTWHAVTPSLTPADVRDVTFRTGWRGYALDEVDGLLERVEELLGP